MGVLFVLRSVPVQRDEGLERVRLLRERGQTPKQIARVLGIRPGEAARLVRAAAAGAEADSPGPALAGFLEAGKSIEEAVHREVFEEVGLKVRNLQYFASQPWPFPHSLMIAFTAEYAGGEMRPCDDEIAEARWFALDALPPLPGPVSISRQLINATIEKLRAR